MLVKGSPDHQGSFKVINSNRNMLENVTVSSVPIDGLPMLDARASGRTVMSKFRSYIYIYI